MRLDPECHVDGTREYLYSCVAFYTFLVSFQHFSALFIDGKTLAIHG